MEVTEKLSIATAHAFHCSYSLSLRRGASSLFTILKLRLGCNNTPFQPLNKCAVNLEYSESRTFMISFSRSAFVDLAGQKHVVESLKGMKVRDLHHKMLTRS